RSGERANPSARRNGGRLSILRSRDSAGQRRRRLPASGHTIPASLSRHELLRHVSLFLAPPDLHAAGRPAPVPAARWPTDAPGQPKVAPSPAGLLERTLTEATRTISAECDKHLADLCVCALDEPRFRLAGAEFIVPSILAMIDQFLQKQQIFGKDFAETSQVA